MVEDTSYLTQAITNDAAASKPILDKLQVIFEQNGVKVKKSVLAAW
jgi:hypothetical protein